MVFYVKIQDNTKSVICYALLLHGSLEYVKIQDNTKSDICYALLLHGSLE